MSLLLKNVRLETGYQYDGKTVVATTTQIKDIYIEKQQFQVIDKQIKCEADVVYDASGQLLVPSFKEMHGHVDKTYFSGPWKAVVPTTKGIFSRFEEEQRILPQQLGVLKERGREMILHYIREGHTHIRTHINVDPVVQTKHVEQIRALFDEFKEQITFELVAFPQHGILRNGIAFEAVLEEALQLGVTHIGGVDPASIDGDSQRVMALIISLAKKYDLGIDLHLHEGNTLGAYEMHQLLHWAEKLQFKNEITFSHAFALADLDQNDFQKLLERFLKHRVNIATTVPIGSGPITMPIAAIHQAGVPVAFGHDSLVDHWSPFGSGDMREKINRYNERFGIIDECGLGQSLKYATGGINSLTAAGHYQWPKVGDPANALLVDAMSSAHLVARRCPISTVISKGKIIHQEEIELKGAFR